MAKDNADNEHIDDLLESDDDLLTPDEPQGAKAEADDKSSADESPKPDAEEPAAPETTPEAKPTEPKAEGPAQAARKGGGSLGVLLVAFLVLILAVVGLGWYASYLRGQVSELTDSVDAATVKADGAQRTASSAANDLLPTAREYALVAKARAEAGNAIGAEADLAQARQLKEVLLRLGASASAVSEVEALIAEGEQALGGEAPEETPAGEETPAAEPSEERASGTAAPDSADEAAAETATESAAGQEPDADEAAGAIADPPPTVPDQMVPSST